LEGRQPAVVQEITPGRFGQWFIFKNPLIPALRFTVGTGLEILAKHERRHLLQAERIRDSPIFPVS
jgi:hypothetical protein